MSESVTLTGTASDSTEISLVVQLGDELVVDGGFDEDPTGWGLQELDVVAPTIDNGALLAPSDGSRGWAYRDPAESFAPGKYRVAFKIVSVGSNPLAHAYLGSVHAPSHNTVGEHVDIVTLSANPEQALNLDVRDCVADDFSIRRIDC